MNQPWAEYNKGTPVLLCHRLAPTIETIPEVRQNTVVLFRCTGMGPVCITETGLDRNRLARHGGEIPF